MNRTIIIILIQICFLSVFADSEAPNKKVIFYSPDKEIMVISTPEDKFIQNKGVTKVFKNNKELFKFNWYSRDIYVINLEDTIYTIRFAQWHRGEVNKDAMVFEIYKNDVLLKSYKVSDILENINDAERSVSHFRVVKEIKGFINTGKKVLFSIINTENKEIIVDIRSLKVKNTSNFRINVN